MSIAKRPSCDVMAKKYGNYQINAKTLKAGDKLDVLCTDGINYIVRVESFDHTTGHIHLHFRGWNKHHDYKGPLKDIYVVEEGTFTGRQASIDLMKVQWATVGNAVVGAKMLEKSRFSIDMKAKEFVFSVMSGISHSIPFAVVATLDFLHVQDQILDYYVLFINVTSEVLHSKKQEPLLIGWSGNSTWMHCKALIQKIASLKSKVQDNGVSARKVGLIKRLVQVSEHTVEYAISARGNRSSLIGYQSAVNNVSIFEELLAPGIDSNDSKSKGKKFKNATNTENHDSTAKLSTTRYPDDFLAKPRWKPLKVQKEILPDIPENIIDNPAPHPLNQIGASPKNEDSGADISVDRASKDITSVTNTSESEPLTIGISLLGSFKSPIATTSSSSHIWKNRPLPQHKLLSSFLSSKKVSSDSKLKAANDSIQLIKETQTINISDRIDSHHFNELKSLEAKVPTSLVSIGSDLTSRTSINSSISETKSSEKGVKRVIDGYDHSGISDSSNKISIGSQNKKFLSLQNGNICDEDSDLESISDERSVLISNSRALSFKKSEIVGTLDNTRGNTPQSDGLHYSDRNRSNNENGTLNFPAPVINESLFNSFKSKIHCENQTGDFTTSNNYHTRAIEDSMAVGEIGHLDICDTEDHKPQTKRRQNCTMIMESGVSNWDNFGSSAIALSDRRGLSIGDTTSQQPTQGDGSSINSSITWIDHLSLPWPDCGRDNNGRNIPDSNTKISSEGCFSRKSDVIGEERKTKDSLFAPWENTNQDFISSTNFSTSNSQFDLRKVDGTSINLLHSQEKDKIARAALTVTPIVTIAEIDSPTNYQQTESVMNFDYVAILDTPHAMEVAYSKSSISILESLRLILDIPRSLEASGKAMEKVNDLLNRHRNRVIEERYGQCFTGTIGSKSLNAREFLISGDEDEFIRNGMCRGNSNVEELNKELENRLKKLTRIHELLQARRCIDNILEDELSNCK